MQMRPLRCTVALSAMASASIISDGDCVAKSAVTSRAESDASGEFRVTPVPDNVIGVNKYDPNYSLTAFARFQPNEFFEATERLPDVSLDIKRQPVLGSGIFYEGESSIANLRRNFETDSFFADYSTLLIAYRLSSSGLSPSALREHLLFLQRLKRRAARTLW